MNTHRLIFASVLLISLAGIVCCQNSMNETTTEIRPSLTVVDQTAAGNAKIARVTVQEVISDGPGWIVIHNDLFGYPGGIVGYAHVDNGSSSNVKIIFDWQSATDVLFADLLYDRGVAGSFEYPVVDTVQGAEVKSFHVFTRWNSMLMNLTKEAIEAGICEECDKFYPF